MREIQPLNQDTRPVDPVYLKGKHGGQYMMEPDKGCTAEGRWVVRGKIIIADFDDGQAYYRIGSWDWPTARRVMDYAIQNDVSMRAALGNLYTRGEPDLLFEQVEKAKAFSSTPTERKIVVSVEFALTAAYQTPVEDVKKALEASLRSYMTNSRFVNFKYHGLKPEVDSYDA